MLTREERLKARQSRSRGAARGMGIDPNTPQGIESIAVNAGLEPPKPGRFINALRTTAGVLGATGSFSAGALRGALDPEESILGSATRGFKESLVDKNPLYFADVLKEHAIQPETRAGKIALGVGGFTADILFDPLTYLTFGMSRGVQLGTRAGSAVATKEFQRQAAKLAATGLEARKAERVVKNMLERAVSKRGLTQEGVEEFMRAGLAQGDIERVARLGPALLDKGGIKFMGRTLVSSETLAKTPVGKAARRLGELEVVQALKRDLGKLFVPDFMSNPKLVRMLDKLTRDERAALNKVLERNKNLFRELDETELSTLFDRMFELKSQRRVGGVLEFKDNPKLQKVADRLLGQTEELRKLGLPDDLDFALSAFGRARNIDEFKDILVSPRFKISQFQSLVFDKASPFTLAKKGPRLPARGSYKPGTKEIALHKKLDAKFGMKDGAYVRFHELSHGLDYETGFMQAIRKGPERQVIRDELLDLSLRTRAAHMFDLDPRTVTWDEIAKRTSPSFLKYLRNQRETIAHLGGMMAINPEEVLRISPRAYNLFAKNLDNIPQFRKILTPDMLKQHGFKTVDDFYNTIKKTGAGDGIIQRVAREAGIDPASALDFYIPSKFRDRMTVKDFARGRNLSSPRMGFANQFTGKESDDLIRNARSAYNLGQIEVATARVRSTAIRQTLSKLGKPIGSMTAEEASRLGYTKFSRNIIGRNKVREEVSAWLPKDVAEELSRFIEPSKDAFTELARWSGFDYATAMFKGHVTSLFPGFHIRNMISNQFQNMLKIGVNAFNLSYQIHALKTMNLINPGTAIRKRIGRSITNDEYAKIMSGKTPNAILKGETKDMTFSEAKKLIDRGSEKMTGHITTKTGKKISYRQIRKMVKENSDILQEGAFGRTAQQLDLVEDMAIGMSDWNPLNPNNILLRTGRDAGFLVDSQTKMVTIISELVDGRTIQQAIKTAEDATFNYGKLTRFEKNVMRRLIPFYVFARKNAELQARALATTPGRSIGMMKAARGLSHTVGEELTQEDMEGLPDFILQNLGIKAGAWADKDGNSQFLTGFGLPIEEFLGRFNGPNGIPINVVRTTLSQLNPLIKFPLERATGVDFFRGRPIIEISDGEALKDTVSMIESLPGPVADQFKELVQWREIKNVPVYKGGKQVGTRTKYTANPFALHLFRNLPTSRYQNTLTFSTDEEQTWFLRGLRFFTGVRSWSIDQETQRYFNDLNRMNELKEWGQRMGVVYPYERILDVSQNERAPSREDRARSRTERAR